MNRRWQLVLGCQAGRVQAEIGEHDRARQVNVEPGLYFIRGRGPDFGPAAISGARLPALPAGRTCLVMRGGEAGRVQAEIGEHDRARQVNVEPGLYFIRGRGPDFLLEGTVVARAGRDTLVDDSRLGRFAYARLVRKGAGVASLAHGPELAYRLRTQLGSDTSSCQGLMTGYGFDLERVNLAARLELCRDTSVNEVLEARTTEASVGARLSHALGPPVADGGRRRGPRRRAPAADVRHQRRRACPLHRGRLPGSGPARRPRSPARPPPLRRHRGQDLLTAPLEGGLRRRALGRLRRRPHRRSRDALVRPLTTRRHGDWTSASGASAAAAPTEHAPWPRVLGC
jgi:hypothetical protein